MARKKTLQTFILYIPADLNMEEVFIKYPLPKILKKDKVIYMIHLIVHVSSRKKDNTNEFTSLYSKILKDKFSSEYTLYIKYLIDCGIVEKKNTYSTSKGKSKGYKIATIYMHTGLKAITISDKVTIKKATTFSNINTEYEYVTSPKPNDLEYFSKWFNKNLQLDYEGAMKELERIRKVEEGKFMLAYEAYLTDKRNKTKRKTYFDLENFEQKYAYRQYPLLKIKNAQYDLNFDGTGGRLHSPLTGLKKELRKFITYDGKKLVAIDITNSQPYLSSILYSQQHFESNNMQQILQIYNKDLDYNNSPAHYYYVSGNVPPDVKRFLEDVTSGKFYENFGKTLIAKGLTPPEFTDVRGYVKKATFAAFFSPTYQSKYVEVIIAFKNVYPEVFRNFEFIKGNKKHNTLACSLQNLEARILLHDVCKEISEKHPSCPIFTIHDSIVTTADNVEKVKAILVKTLTKRVGYKPYLKLEKWE